MVEKTPSKSSGKPSRTTGPRPTRRILVTGATSGIGLAVSRRLLRSGVGVVGLGRDFTAWQDDTDADFLPQTVDLSDLDALPEVLTNILRRCPDIDGAVLAAGRGLLGHLEQFSYPQIRQLMDLNFTSQAFVARALMPHLKRRGGGDLIFMGSEAALEGKRQGSVYCAGKFALRGFAQALRQEGAKGGVRVGLIHPGVVRTPFFDELKIEPGPQAEHALEAEDVAASVQFMLSLPPGAVVDELRLAPLQQAVRFRGRSETSSGED